MATTIHQTGRDHAHAAPHGAHGNPAHPHPAHPHPVHAHPVHGPPHHHATEGERRPWQQWAMLGLGLATVLSPWIFGYRGIEAAVMNAAIVGLLVFALAALALTLLDGWENFVLFPLGLWLAAAPWLLGYSIYAQALWSQVGLGLAIAALAALAIRRRDRDEDRA